MNNPAHPSLEGTLERAYRQEAGLYEQFLQLSEKLPQSVASGGGDGDVFGEVNRLMDRISQVDGEIAALREQWKAARRKPGPGLAEALKMVETLIVRLMRQIDAAERAAQDSKDRLVPRLSEENLRRKMRAAYATAAGQPQHRAPAADDGIAVVRKEC